MMKDGKIVCMETGALAALRVEGTLRGDTLKTGSAFRDIVGLDDRVWQHLLDCAEHVRQEKVMAGYESALLKAERKLESES